MVYGLGSAARALIGACATALFTFGVSAFAGDDSCEPHWARGFGSTLITPSGDARAIVTHHTSLEGDVDGPVLYVGGTFPNAAGLPGGSVMRWDGQTWTRIGVNLSGEVRALAIFDDGGGGGPALYAGGVLYTHGASVAQYILRWNGQSWSNAVVGLNNAVEALAVYDDGLGGGPALYAAGRFSMYYQHTVRFLVKWSGAQWVEVGGGLSSAAFALVVHDDGSGDALYVAGQFGTAGGTPATRIARWDGASWSTVGGLGSRVFALAVYDDGLGGGPSLYAVGSFMQAINGGVPFDVGRIARWDGQQWSRVGGVFDGLNDEARALHVFNDGLGPNGGASLYVGGRFTGVGNIDANGVARWDGQSWSSVGSSVDGEVNAFGVFDDGDGDALIVAGDFEAAGEAFAPSVVAWTGAAWKSIHGSDHGNYGDQGMNNTVAALAIFDDGSGGGPALYAGGTFTMAGPSEASYIARWDGEAWHEVGGGLNAPVSAMVVHDDGSGSGPALYVGGAFTVPGDDASYGIARWDGQQWSSVGGGVSDDVLALCVYDDGAGGGPELYAGGQFTQAGGTPVARIAKWDGQSWSPLGMGVHGSANDSVYTMAVFDAGNGPVLYVGGWFYYAGYAASSHIARWNGQSWSRVGAHGADYTVHALATHDDGSGDGPALYVGGTFDSVSGVYTRGVARWNGAAWSTIGGGGIAGNGVYALASFDDGSGSGPALYAGGLYDSIDGVEARGLARWDGGSWSAAGSGVDARVVAMTPFYNEPDGAPSLYAGGMFVYMDGLVSARIGRLRGCVRECHGDANGDGVVDMVDFALVLDDYGLSGAGLDGDLNGDGVVDFADFSLVLAHYGAACR